MQWDGAPDGLLHAVIARTRRVQRRRRWTRRGGVVLAALLLFAGGFASARLGERVESAPESSPPVASISVSASAEPAELELAAEACAGAERAALLRRAGDAYLVEYGDIERALRCYRRYLSAAPAPSSTREESWLLTALRTQRL